MVGQQLSNCGVLCLPKVRTVVSNELIANKDKTSYLQRVNHPTNDSTKLFLLVHQHSKSEGPRFGEWFVGQRLAKQTFLIISQPGYSIISQTFRLSHLFLLLWSPNIVYSCQNSSI